jgi:hypothetical protein
MELQPNDDEDDLSVLLMDVQSPLCGECWESK